MAGSKALEGLKVVDLTWVVVGPAAIRMLADYGATVVHVESQTRVDTARTIQPFKNAQPGPENSGLYQNMNAGKLAITLNLNTEAGRDVLRRLVEWADVLVEAYTPGQMARWGFDYDSVRSMNPSIVMLSTCLAGQTGPMAALPGYGTMGAAFGGFIDMAGWTDRPPAGPVGAYTDYVAPKFIAASILAALEYRRRTGQGQFIDLSQAEAAMHFLGPALLDSSVNNRPSTRNGNADTAAAPHGIYPCEEEDSWVAIAVETDAQWHGLCDAAGHPEWSSHPRFDSFLHRRANSDALDEAISEWTRGLTNAAVEWLLQERGVPSSAVMTSDDCFADPQVIERGHFETVVHPDLGEVPLETSRFRMSRTPHQPLSAAGRFGEHNDTVLRDILGLNDDEIVELTVAGALE